MTLAATTVAAVLLAASSVDEAAPTGRALVQRALECRWRDGDRRCAVAADELAGTEEYFFVARPLHVEKSKAGWKALVKRSTVARHAGVPFVLMNYQLDATGNVTARTCQSPLPRAGDKLWTLSYPPTSIDGATVEFNDPCFVATDCNEHWAVQYLVRGGVLQSPTKKKFQIPGDGRCTPSLRQEISIPALDFMPVEARSEGGVWVAPEGTQTVRVGKHELMLAGGPEGTFYEFVPDLASAARWENLRAASDAEAAVGPVRFDGRIALLSNGAAYAVDGKEPVRLCRSALHQAFTQATPRLSAQVIQLGMGSFTESLSCAK